MEACCTRFRNACLRPGVLHNVLEDTHSAEGGFITIPMDDSSTDTWQQALCFIHAHSTAEVTWEMATPEMLLLANKYDLTGVTGKSNIVCSVLTAHASLKQVAACFDVAEF